jgi:hypothetical protein
MILYPDTTLRLASSIGKEYYRYCLYPLPARLAIFTAEEIAGQRSKLSLATFAWISKSTSSEIRRAVRPQPHTVPEPPTYGKYRNLWSRSANHPTGSDCGLLESFEKIPQGALNYYALAQAAAPETDGGRGHGKAVVYSVRPSAMSARMLLQ